MLEVSMWRFECLATVHGGNRAPLTLLQRHQERRPRHGEACSGELPQNSFSTRWTAIMEIGDGIFMAREQVGLDNVRGRIPILPPTGESLRSPLRRSARLRAVVTAALFLTISATGAATERRCGWYLNPTPANLLLADKDGEWWITSQSEAVGPDAQGVDEHAPQFDDKEYVKTQPNGRGYGCACLTVETNSAEKRITKVTGGQILPLARCRADKSLPKPDK